MADIAKSGTAPVNTNLVTTPHANGPRTLSEGDSGPDVVALQNQLAALGFNPGSPDGKLGKKTIEAIVHFQNSHGLAADGEVGPETRAKMAAAAPVKKADAVDVSKGAAEAAGKAAAQHHDIMNYPAGEAAKVATPVAPHEKSRAEEQQQSAKNLLDRLALNAQVAAIKLDPIFFPAALAISAQANANTIRRYETETPKKDFAVIAAEEDAKATKAILALPGQYAQAGLDGINYVKNAALAGAGIVSSAAVTGWNATVDGVASAYNTTVDYGSQALTTAAEVGNQAIDTTKKDVKKGWHWATTPIRSVGKWLSTLGGN